MDIDFARLVDQAEGSMRGIIAVQDALECAPARLSELEGATLPLGQAVPVLAGNDVLHELMAYASDASEALNELAARGSAVAAAVVWDVYRCDPGRADATLASMLSANLEACTALLRDCAPSGNA